MPHPFTTFYRGKRVLITGHTGFSGGWTVAWLKSLGAQVHGYGLPPASRPNFFDATLLDRGMSSIFADIRDRNSLANAFAEFQPEIVIHRASRSNPELAEAAPVETFSTNVMGTVFLLEEARLTASVRALVNVTSGSDPKHGDRRDFAHEQVNIQRASLRCSELAESAFSNSFLRGTTTAVATARSRDAIGGGDWRPGRIVPSLVHHLISGEPVEVRNRPSLQIWHVLDEVHAVLLLAQRLFECGHQYSGAWDLGPDEGTGGSPADFADDFVKSWDSSDVGSATRPGRARSYSPESSGDDGSLGWPNVLNTKAAIGWTVEWYRGFYAEPSAAWRMTEEQIARYMRSAKAFLSARSRERRVTRGQHAESGCTRS
jgi:CDP-glucose 4,6-dehydratase